MKRSVLCYGDSNTWGYEPGTGKRFGKEIRWTGLLANLLGPEYEIIEEGLNGRTIAQDDPFEKYKNGKDYLAPCLISHRPVWLVIVMLGTNNLKARHRQSAEDVAEGLSDLIQVIQDRENSSLYSSPKSLFIIPPPLAKLSNLAEMFEAGTEKSKLFSKYMTRVLENNNCDYIDSSKLICSSDIDGVHFEPQEHEELAKAVAERIRSMV